MKRLSVIAMVFMVAVLGWPGATRAQMIPTPPPTPAPDPLVYRDPGMSFRAPSTFLPVAARHVALSDLGEDPTALAMWVYPSKDTPRRIVLQAEAYEGSVGNWDGEFEQQMRGQIDGALFKNKTNFAFKNGMPAMFMTLTAGEGFDVKKFYCVIWADGSRGMALMLIATLGDLDEAHAREMLSDVTAVRYPADRG